MEHASCDGIAAAMCIRIGVYPSVLYDILPNRAFDDHYGQTYNAYSVTHVITQFELLLFAALAFGILIRMKAYPPEVPSVNLDFDWVYRKLLPKVGMSFVTLFSAMGKAAGEIIMVRVAKAQNVAVNAFFGKGSRFGKDVDSSSSAMWAAVLLGVYLFLYYV